MPQEFAFQEKIIAGRQFQSCINRPSDLRKELLEYVLQLFRYDRPALTNGCEHGFFAAEIGR